MKKGKINTSFVFKAQIVHQVFKYEIFFLKLLDWDNELGGLHFWRKCWNLDKFSSVLYLKKRMEAKQLCFLSAVVMSFIPQGAH